MKIQPDKVVQWCRDGDFLRPLFSASCMQYISDLHSKFAPRPHCVQVWLTSSLWPLRLGEGKPRKKKERNRTLCLKKRPTFTTCYNFYIHSVIATIFGINVAEKVGNQKTLYYATSPQITCASALPGKMRKHENRIFHSIELCYTHDALVSYLPERKNVICNVFDSV